MNTEIKKYIPEKVLNRLYDFFKYFWEIKHKELYLVGGGVRDIVLGRPAKDYDLCTNASIDEIKQICKELNVETFDSGIKHGTITLIDSISEQNYEITVYRSESSYSDNRHPDSVIFIQDLKKDLARRDFTINAIAYNILTDELVDPFGGLKDLQAGIVRAVGDPKERFKEDALRILRGLRFACKYNFHIENGTMFAMFFQKDLLDNISAERIHDEIIRIFAYETVGELMQGFMPGAIINHIIPEFKYLNKQLFKLVGHNYLRNFLGLCAYLDEDKVEAILTRLKFSNKDAKVIRLLRTEVRDSHLDTYYTVATLAHKLVDNEHYTPNEAWGMITNVLLAQEDFLCMSRGNKYYFEANDAIKDVFDNGCYSLKQLAVDGNDMITLGYKGKQIAIALEYLLEEVYSKRATNNKEALLSLADNLLTRE